MLPLRSNYVKKSIFQKITGFFWNFFDNLWQIVIKLRYEINFWFHHADRITDWLLLQYQRFLLRLGSTPRRSKNLTNICSILSAIRNIWSGSVMRRWTAKFCTATRAATLRRCSIFPDSCWNVSIFQNNIKFRVAIPWKPSNLWNGACNSGNIRRLKKA